MIIESTGEAPETAKAVAQISRTQCADPAHWKLAKTRDLPSTLPAVLRFLSSRRKRRPSVAHYRSSARMRGCATGATSSEQLKISDETGRVSSSRLLKCNSKNIVLTQIPVFSKLY